MHLLALLLDGELELELILSQMAQKPMLRGEVGARALRVRSDVRGHGPYGGEKKLLLIMPFQNNECRVPYNVVTTQLLELRKSYTAMRPTTGM